MSVFAIPVSKGAKAIRVALVLAVNVGLVAGGVAMIVSYVGARDRARNSAVADNVSHDDAVAKRADHLDGGTPIEPHRGAEVDVLEVRPESAQRPQRPAPSSRQPPQPRRPTAKPSSSRPTVSRQPARAIDAGAHPAARPRSADASTPRPSRPASGGAPTEAQIKKLRSLVALEMLRSRQRLMRCADGAGGAAAAKGTVEIRFLLLAAGTVSQVAVSRNSTGSASTARCVVGVVRGWRFPPPPGGRAVRFVWPFAF